MVNTFLAATTRASPSLRLVVSAFHPATAEDASKMVHSESTSGFNQHTTRTANTSQLARQPRSRSPSPYKFHRQPFSRRSRLQSALPPPRHLRCRIIRLDKRQRRRRSNQKHHLLLRLQHQNARRLPRRLSRRAHSRPLHRRRRPGRRLIRESRRPNVFSASCQ